MVRRIDEDELVEHFTLSSEEHDLLHDKSGVGRLGFSLLLKYLRWKGRFPRGRSELPEGSVEFVAKQVGAIRLGTASTEAILRRFTKDVTHPAYAAMLEVGRAQRTIFLAHWLRDRDLQRETNSGLNVVENYNGVGDYIHFGKRGEFASNRREEQELSMLCLQILQSSLGFINTLMIQDTLAEPEWAQGLGEPDRRGLTPLFTSNMTPYGQVLLRPDRRLDLRATALPRPPEAADTTGLGDQQ